MSTQLHRQGIRLRADERSRQPLLDAYTNATPQGWARAATQFEVALASGGSLVDVSNLSSVTLAGAPYDDRGGACAFFRTLAGADLNNTLTEAAWADGSAQHALFTFSNAEMNLPLDGADAADFWLVITALTQAGDGIVCGTGRFTVRDDGAFTDAPLPPANPGAGITVDQADARYARLGANGGSGEFLAAITSVGDGTRHSLESVPTAGSALPALCTVYLPASDELQSWLLAASTAATAAGTIQRPLDYDATANARAWFRKR